MGGWVVGGEAAIIGCGDRSLKLEQAERMRLTGAQRHLTGTKLTGLRLWFSHEVNDCVP